MKSSKAATRMRLTDQKRIAIIEAAAAEFRKDGFAGASMDRISARADVSKRTVYNHFPSKACLFEAIVAELLQRAGDTPVIEYDAARPLADQLHLIGCDFGERMMSDEVLSLARVAISRFMHSPEIAAETIGVHEKSKGVLIRWLKAAKKGGRLSIGNELRAARLFTALILEFAFWPQLMGSEQKLSKRELGSVVRMATEMFLARFSTQVRCEPES